MVDECSLDLADCTLYSPKVAYDFYVQRIHNIEEARRISMLNIPFSQEGVEEPITTISSLRFNSLLDVNSTMRFCFAVIDEAGNALFHSDDEFSLVENFIFETANNRELINVNKLSLKPAFYHELEFEYKGIDNYAVVGSLLNRQNDMPWRLIVFYWYYH